MKNYTFLLKPLFYIFSLLFATWLVIKIETLSPSDFGQSKTDMEERKAGIKDLQLPRQYLHSLSVAYKSGVIDSAKLDQELTIFLDLLKKASKK